MRLVKLVAQTSLDVTTPPMRFLVLPHRQILALILVVVIANNLLRLQLIRLVAPMVQQAVIPAASVDLL